MKKNHIFTQAKTNKNKIKNRINEAKPQSTKFIENDKSNTKKTNRKNFQKKKNIGLNKKNKHSKVIDKKIKNKKKYKTPILMRSDNRTRFIDEEIVYKIIKESK